MTTNVPLFFNGGLRSICAQLRSPHRIMGRGDRFAWIGELGRSGVLAVDIHVRVMARVVVIRGLRKGHKGEHGGGSHSFGIVI